jgi:circadian clock protein KaiC
MTGEMAPTRSEPQQSERISTGISGLDEILRGGFIRGGFYLLQGDPGSGKTTLALQYLLERAHAGEKTLYITMTESERDLEMVCRAHGWRLEGIDVCDLTLTVNKLSLQGTKSVFYPNETDLTEITSTILGRIEKTNPIHIVLDGASEMRLLSGDSLRYRRHLMALKDHLTRRGVTAILLDDRMAQAGVMHSETVVGGNLVLECHLPEYGRARRRLFVNKVRAGDFQEGFHDYEIHTGGLMVYPRLVSSEHHKPFTLEFRPSGIANLDGMLAGGLRSGTSSVFIGPSGVGKSTLAMQYVSQGLRMGLKAAVYTFDEVLATFIERSEKITHGSRGALKPYMDDGRLIAQQVDPAELTPGAFAQRVRDAVKGGASIVVIDSLNGYINAMPQERLLSAHLHELVSYLNQMGIVTIMVAAQHGIIRAVTADFNVSYLADTVLLFRYFEGHGEILPGLSVFKNRSGPHDRSLRQLSLTDRGILVSEPILGLHGLASGLPLYDGASINEAPLFHDAGNGQRN